MLWQLTHRSSWVQLAVFWGINNIWPIASIWYFMLWVSCYVLKRSQTSPLSALSDLMASFCCLMTNRLWSSGLIIAHAVNSICEIMNFISQRIQFWCVLFALTWAFDDFPPSKKVIRHISCVYSDQPSGRKALKKCAEDADVLCSGALKSFLTVIRYLSSEINDRI